MDSNDKLIAVFFSLVAILLLSLVGWGIIATNNAHNFEIQCIKSGNTIQHRTLDGSSTPVKECKSE